MIGKNVPLTYLQNVIFVKRCNPKAVLPTQAEGDVGFDISSIEDIELSPGKTTVVKTGLMLAETIEPLVLENKIVATPFLKIEGRSGLALRGVFPVGGIVDPQYRGEIGVMLFNSTTEPVKFPAGSRIAQFVCYFVMSNIGCAHVAFLEKNDSSQTQRGAGGFGSTGV